MAMRMAVMALRKAAEARMNTSRARWLSVSSLSRSLRELLGGGLPMLPAPLASGRSGRSVIVARVRVVARARPRPSGHAIASHASQICESLPGLRWRRIIRQFVLAGIRALDFEFVKQERWADHGGGDSASAIADQRIVADRNQIAAQSARVEFVENRAAHQLFVTIG